ncbi:MAG: hypothetical protein H6716_24430 [Polyangiaceae bacterium]|nr:hypothetical protein [Polyangiaceae bacterium]
MANWILGIDESGRVDDRGDHALLGGVLIREHDTSLFRRELRKAIEASLPGIPWPPHATDLRLVSTRPSLAARGVPGAPASASSAANAWGLRPDTSMARAALEALSDREDELPKKLLATLRNQRSRDFERFGRVTEALGGGQGTAWVVAAWEDAGVGEPGVPRYLRLLDALAERVELCLERQPGGDGAVKHDVLFHSSSYAVWRQRVTERDLARVSSIQRGIRWLPTSPQEAKQDGVHPLLIVADFACNHVRNVIGKNVKPGTPWSAFASRTRTRTGLPPECGVRTFSAPLPAVAALGVPHQVLSQRLERGVDAAAKDAALATLSGCEPTWAREQAEAWLEVL